MSNNFRRTAVLKKYDLSVLRKLFDIRFSYKHCNFSRPTRQDGVENKARSIVVCIQFEQRYSFVTASFQSVEALFSETDEAGLFTMTLRVFVSRFLKSTFIKHKSKQGSVTYYK